MRPIRPLLYDKAPRWTDETETECGCDFCQHWSPLIEHVNAQLNEEGKTLFNELVTQWMNESDELSYVTAKLNGSWPGWEKMKDFQPEYPDDTEPDSHDSSVL